MSGLEAIGVAASIIQVADLGTKLSVQLFSFYRRYKNANESIQLLSNEIALVSAILRELGDNLKGEESSKLCSDEAFRTLRLVLTQCRDVLGQIQRVVDGNDQPGKSRFQQVTGKFRIVMLEPSLDQLKMNLERLKSTMLLLLNVIMYAGQIRSNNVPILVQEQRDLIQSLLNDRQVDSPNPRQLDEATESPRGFSTRKRQPRGKFANPWVDEVPRQKQTLKDYLASKNQSPWASTEPTNSSGAKTPAPGATQGNEPPELEEYNILIQSMLREIESCRNKLEKTRHSRIKDGVLNIHSGEMMRFTVEYGPSINIDHSLFAEQKSETVLQPEVRDFNPCVTSSRHSSRSGKAPSIFDSDDSSISETDMTIRTRRGRTSSHRRSISRTRRPRASERPRMPMQQPPRSNRSSSPDRHSIVEPKPETIINKPTQRANNSNSRATMPRQQSTSESDSDDLPGQISGDSIRRRAFGNVSHHVSAHPRVHELGMSQSTLNESYYSRREMEIFKQSQEIERLEDELEKPPMLEKSDFRQDIEMWKQEQEIERLERELEKQLLLEKIGFDQNIEIRKQQRKIALLARDLRRSRQRAAAETDLRKSRLLHGEKARNEDELSARLRRLEGTERKGRSEYRPKLRRVVRPEEEDAAGRGEIRRYKQDDTPGSVSRNSDQEREPEDGLEVSVVGRGGDDSQEQTISDLSLPGNLEDLLAQWTTLDKQEIQRGQIEAF